ncbi:DUF6538 domain-containing protein [Azospirillum doebereinerae]|uniref:site-specific integrase n=1 Tax=Azospirillum doebereinerae TaxID=92933 RepID=UPI001EE5F6BA|nr:site-specific integrase [Azospirillum doebereinerae]MCG5240962.1 site-specific integrase [Azospirillum doebereinerae]
MTNLRKSRYGVYQVRRDVPPGLVGIVGRETLIRSTGEKDPEAAKKIARKINVELDRFFEKMSKKLAEGTEAETSCDVLDDGFTAGLTGMTLPFFEPAMFDEITLDDAKLMASWWVQEQIRVHEDRIATGGVHAPAYGPLWPHYEPTGIWGPPDIKSYRVDLARQLNRPIRRPAIQTQIQDIDLTGSDIELAIWITSGRFGLILKPGGDSWNRLRYAILLAEQMAVTERARINAGGGSVVLPLAQAPAPPHKKVAALVTPVALSVQTKTTTVPDGIAIQEVIDAYAKERQPSTRTIKEYQRGFDLFAEFTRIKLSDPVTIITREHVRDFKTALMKCPSNRQTARFRGKSLRTVIEITEGEDLPRMKPDTINKYLGGIKAALSWAEVNCHISVNPAAKITVKSKTNGERKRLPFSPQDLNTIFSSKIYRDSYWNERYWIPLIGFYTGARVEEIGQLCLTDIRDEDGVIYFQLDTYSEGQSLKNAPSRRKIPIRTELIDLGFLDYVEVLRQRGEDRVFPGLSDRDGKLSQGFSQWFGRFLTRLKITDPSKVFHSFRHNFEDVCRRPNRDGVMLNERLLDRLTGHATPGMSTRYGLGFDLLTLDKAMQSLTFPVLPRLEPGRFDPAERRPRGRPRRS